MINIRACLLAGALCAMAISPALADKPADRGPTPGLGWGPGGSKSVAAPGPIVGVGLPAFGAVAGYLWLSARSRRTRKDKGKQ